LRHVVSIRPRLGPDVRDAIREHDAVLQQIDGLVASLTAGVGDETNAAALSSTLKVSSALISHHRHTTAIVYEWANRDIGGES
jgi:hypothetical protein